MKKLKGKVFLVVFLILTICLVTILVTSNYLNYKRQIDSIRTTLLRMDDNRNRNNIIPSDKIIGIINPIQPLENTKIFMDSRIYAVRLDTYNNVIEIVNHTPDDVNEEKIKKIVQNIISEKNTERFKISNLIFNDYSYLFFKERSSLIIMDNSNEQNIVIQSVRTAFLLFIILEFVIIYISKKLTSWIIKPIIETFDKQKQFITDASHELKTPLAVIIASSDALENEPSETKWLDNIKSEADRMNILITDLLEMAKSENGIKESYVVENISKAVEMSVLTFESMIFEKEIKLDYDIQEDIVLLCNSNQIKQLVSILIDNAIKHSCVNGEIIINLKKEKGNIILNVTNKGEEIPKQEREKIFERFYRVDQSRNRNDNRYGLGLSIAKNIVTNHNGTIQVNCENGYTTFKVIIKSKN